MTLNRLKDKVVSYRRAIERLEDALSEDESNPLLYDGVIQRFEFTYELAWKMIKAYLEYAGIVEVNSPRVAFKEGFSAGLVDNGDTWIEMISDRNMTVHLYDKEKAKEIYERIRDQYYEELVKLAQHMEEVLQ